VATETAKLIALPNRAKARNAARRAVQLAAWARPITAMDACWAAGHFEGEGTILIHQKPRGTSRFSPRVSLISTDKEVIDFFCELWPARVHGPYQPNSPNAKVQYGWTVTDAFKVREFLLRLLPYFKRTLVRKRAAILIEFCDQALANYRQRGQDPWKEQAYEILKALNHRGV